MNRLSEHVKPTVLFVDMNSFFASCEQQDNYWLRGRPVAVCVYTGPKGCVIAPSVEAKQQGVRLGVRLNEAMKICPDLVPVETHPQRYRDYHVKLIEVLRQFSPDVMPKSIDEAVVDLTNSPFLHREVVEVAHLIKKAIREKVGDWFRCSIGIAPNAFLAKLGSELHKPDGLTIITPETIDDLLRTITLTDLPGIGERMAQRLQTHGIDTPLALRYASPERLKAVCKSIIGWHWHLRLNFGGEVDLKSHSYKSMSAMRTVSAAQRRSADQLDGLCFSLCLTLERRMVRNEVFCQLITVCCSYESGQRYDEEIKCQQPVQDGADMFRIITQRMERFRQVHHCEPVLNPYLKSISVCVYDFIPAQLVPYSLFEDNTRRDRLRKTVHDIKSRFGVDKLIRAAELRDEPIYRDVIGFGSIRDLHDDQNPF